MKSRHHSDAIDVSLCDDNFIDLNTWDNDLQAWRAPLNSLSPDVSRRAHELYCVPCGKHIMPSQLHDHLNLEKHERSVTWFKSQKHRSDHSSKKTVAIPPPPSSSGLRKFPPPPPSSLKREKDRSRSPLLRNRVSSGLQKPTSIDTPIQLINTFTPDITLDQLMPADEQFIKSLPSFMQPPNSLPDAALPPGPTFYPAGHLETRAKSAAFAPVPEVQWLDWVSPKISHRPVPPPPLRNHERNDDLGNWSVDAVHIPEEYRQEVGPSAERQVVHVDVPRDPPMPPPRNIRDHDFSRTLQQEFPGATIIIVPPGALLPQFANHGHFSFSSQIPQPSVQNVLQVPPHSLFQMGQHMLQPSFSPNVSPSLAYPPAQWTPFPYGPMFHTWR